jgi:hypothetical protein
LAAEERGTRLNYRIIDSASDYEPLYSNIDPKLFYMAFPCTQNLYGALSREYALSFCVDAPESASVAKRAHIKVIIDLQNLVIVISEFHLFSLQP